MQFEKKPLALAVSALLVTGTLLSGCGGGSSGGGGGGNYTMNLAGGNGGTGANAYGGDGGELDVYLNGGTGGVEIKRSGSASTAFSSQAGKITPHLGINPLVIDSDTTMLVVDYYNTVGNGAVTTAGQIYVGSDGVMRIATGLTADYAADAMVDDGRLYIWTGNNEELLTAVGNDTAPDAAAADTVYMSMGSAAIRTSDGDLAIGDPRITGIEVAKDVTLTLPLNYISYAGIDVENDFVNKGTIITADYTATNRGSFQLFSSSFINSGTIDTSGSGTVINGGFVEVWTDYAAINSDVINTSGADNAAGAGGNAGYIQIFSDYYTENTADLIARGGNGTGDIGGDGNRVDIHSSYGPALSKGGIYANGGDGTVGGDGDWVYIVSSMGGDTLNAGNINISGGNGSAGAGGDAGGIDLYNDGGLLASSGDIIARGGNASADNNAGNGGYVYLFNEPGFSSWGYGTTPHQGIELSGDIDLAGGDTSGTGDGGYGGGLYVRTDNYGSGSEAYAKDQGIFLLGYNTIDTTGGDGQFPGGGGDVDLYADYGWDDALYTYGITGPVMNAADIMANAGAYTGTADTGTHYAQGGDLSFETSYYYGSLNPQTRLTNTGDISVNGANGKNTTSTRYLGSGRVYMWGFNGVNNSGAITANGGTDVATDGGTDGQGGENDWIGLYAELGPVVNSGTITANGGDGEYRGGYGSDWTSFYGPEVKSSGKIVAKGGDADTTLATYRPGYGGWVWMMGTNGPTSVSNSASISLTPGTGYTDVYPEQAGYYKVIGAHCEGDC